MKPIHFKEAQLKLTKPDSMEDCGSLWVHNSDNECISLWTVPFWQRVKFLFHGNVWLGVHGSSKNQPPVWLDMTKTVFIKEIDEL